MNYTIHNLSSYKKRVVTFLLLMFCLNLAFSQQNTNSTISKFEDYLKTLATQPVQQLNNQTFNTTCWNFWHQHKIDYNRFPQKYKKALDLYYQCKQRFKNNTPNDSMRFDNAIHQFEKFDNRNTLPQQANLFVGSSSIEGWTTAKSFSNLPIINRGIGGIDMATIIKHYNTLVKKYKPSAVVIYCDIDIEMGKSPQQAKVLFTTLITKIQSDFPSTKIVLMAMKPTLIDDFLGENVRKNKVIINKWFKDFSAKYAKVFFADVAKPMFTKKYQLKSDIFLPDGMHLNNSGYKLWQPIVGEILYDKQK